MLDVEKLVAVEDEVDSLRQQVKFSDEALEKLRLRIGDCSTDQRSSYVVEYHRIMQIMQVTSVTFSCCCKAVRCCKAFGSFPFKVSKGIHGWHTSILRYGYYNALILRGYTAHFSEIKLLDI